MSLTATQRSRALGALLALAASETLVGLSPSGGWGEGTALSIPLLEALGAGLDLRQADAQGRVVRRWIEWALSMPDAAAPSPALAVLNMLAQHDWEEQADDTVAGACAQTAKTHASKPGDPLDAGAVLRSGVLALGFLADNEAKLAPLAEAARAVAALTDSSPDAADASAVWAAVLRNAILTGEVDLHSAVAAVLPAARAAVWAGYLERLSGGVPDTHSAVSILLAAYAAFRTATNSNSTAGFNHVMELVMDQNGPYFTPATVALTGCLVGAARGADAVPADYRANAHGWPGVVEDGLERLVNEALEAAAAGLTTRASGHAGAVPGYGAPGYGAHPPPFGASAFDPPPFVDPSPFGAPGIGQAPAYIPAGHGMPPGYDAPPPGY
jgi:hypothetical protein